MRPDLRAFRLCDVEPTPLPLDRLEATAACSEPTATAAWWVTLQTARHVIEIATDRDLHTGDSLPMPLSKVLSTIVQRTRSGVRPIPADHLHRSTCLALDAVRSVLARPRTRLLREHRQRPLYDLREMDAQCMAWLARQPGRSIREKLAGKQHALSVVRHFSLDTPENRVMCRVLALLHRRLNLRFDAAATYDPEGPCNTRQREMFDLCRHALRTTEFASVPPSEMPRPNNVLLNDRHYSRLWRAWMLLDQEEQALESAWSHVKEDFTTALFWILAGHLATTHGARVPEALIVPATEIGGRTIIADRSGAEVRNMVLLVTSREPTDDGALVIHLRRTNAGLSTTVSTLSAERDLPSETPELVKSVKKHGEHSLGFLPSAAKSRHGRHARAKAPYRTRPPSLQAASIEAEEQVSWRIEFGDGLDLTPGRGAPVLAVRDDPEPQSRIHANTLADLGGLRDLSCMLNPLSTRTPEKGTEIVNEDNPEHSEIGDVGIDAFGWRFFVHGAEPIRPRTLPYALRHESAGNSVGAGWQVGTSLRLPQVARGTIIDPITAAVDAGNSGDEQSVTIGCRHVFRALADELDELQASRAGTAAFVVPDGLDDFSQQALRAAVRSGFPKSWPVARSVAAALSWQQHAGFLAATVKDGDNILVLSADVIGLTITLLVARRDRNLMDARPETGGIFWERRPEIPCDEYGDGLGIRDLWLDYTRQLVDAMGDDAAKPRDEAYREFLVSYLIDTGLPQGTAHSGAADWIFDTWASDAERWLVLEHAPAIWREAVQRWCNP